MDSGPRAGVLDGESAAPVNVPNVISLGRLLAVPVTVWLVLSGQLLAAFWLFVAAGISDAVDGFIAKRFDAETEFGQYLDPIADKVLLVSVYLALGNEGYLETWLVIMVVFRDALIVGGALLFQTLTQSLTMQPLKVSKVNTVAQIVLAAVVLGVHGYAIAGDGVVEGVVEVLVYTVTVTTLLSGGAYVVTWSRRAAAMEKRD